MRSRKRRIIAYLAGGLVLFLVAAAIALVLLAHSQWFHGKVRDRIIAETEKATGGRAEIGKFEFDWKTMRASVAPFALHGKEKPGEPVFFQTGSIEVGLKVVSVLKKDIDIASLIVDRPEVHILFYPDGTNNVPEPKVKRKGGNFADQILRLAVQRFEFRNGLVHVRDERTPVDVRGEQLTVAFDYDGTGPRYKGHVSSRKLHLNSRNLKDAAFDFDSDLVFERDRLLVSNAVFDMGDTRMVANGSLHDWQALVGEFDFEGHATLSELAKIVPVPVERRGEVDVKGRAALTWPGGFKVNIDGNANARNLAYRDQHVRVDGIALRTDFHLTRDGISLPHVRAGALGGTFDGRADFKNGFSRVEVEGTVRHVGIDEVTRVVSRPRLAWSGIASGPVRVDGIITGGPPRNFTIQANMNIERGSGGIPIEGNVDLVYDQRMGSLRLSNSTLKTDATEIKASGTLGETLRVSLRTNNLDDLLPGIAMAGPDALKEMPVRLLSGAAAAEAVLTGPLQNPRITGKVSAGAFEWQGRRFERGSADIDVSSNELAAKNIDLVHKAGRVAGSGRVALSAWKARDDSPVAASAELRGGDLKQLLAETGRALPFTGAVQADVRVKGTVGSPDAEFELKVNRPSGYGETLDDFRASGRLTNRSVEITSGAMRLGRSQLEFTGGYQASVREWTSGTIRFQASGAGLTLDQLEHVRDYASGISGQVQLKAVGTAQVRNSDLDLDSLDAQFSIAGITVGQSPVGAVSLTARTEGDVLRASLTGTVKGSKVKGSGEWRLTGDYPGRAEIQFTPVSLAALHDLATRGKVERELPFTGSMEGHATISGPLKKPEELRADVVIPRIEVAQNPSQPIRTVSRQDLTLRNTAPVRLSATTKAVTIQSAQLAGADTTIEASGRVTFDAKSPWDVAVKGQINLPILQLFNADLLAKGSAVLDGAIRGSLQDPQITGRLELKNASLYLRDLPAGVDSANGLVTFDRNRANIEKLTAEVGGGRVAFGGFIGFSSGLLLYRVQANADQVRFRHPDGVSVTVNALLNLTGTSENGLVSGSVTVLRAGFAPRADLGGLLAQTAKPLPAPAAPNEYLRGLSFDVRIESGPSLQFQTSLTRDLQTEAELRLRGNAARPILVGDVSVSQGEVQFFGNKYTINRGEIRFINPTKVEPVFDVDLETKARGITVNISFTGTLSKLNLTYRSDPPLQTTDIIALLAVGRDPTTSAFANAQARSNLLQSGANTLGQAIAAPVSSRLQRFFGVSRLKIDPQLTGVENIPQARLTLEQQVSRDITLTYITNLTRTQEQIVRIQWDINRQWSAVAVREENGVFGIDFQYRKRFK